MSAGVPLAELTALLARQLAESAAVAERRQRDAYVALAAEVDGTLEAFVDRAIGSTEAERRETAERYLTGVVVPLLPRSRQVARQIAASEVRFDRTGIDRLAEHFGDDVREAIDPGERSGTFAIARARLEELILDKLRGEAEARYRDGRMLLRAGVPHTQIRAAKLSTKVLLEDDGKGSVRARLANEQSAKECAEAISTLTVDFSVGAFPPFE